MADEIVHITWGRARCNPSGSGGAWVAECLCGWAKGGDFALSGEPGRAAAERLAEAFAVDHVDEAGEHAVNHPSNPDWQPPDNRLPRPVDRARPVSGSPFGPGAWDGLGPASIPVLPPLEHCPVCQEMMAPWSLPMHLREVHPVGGDCPTSVDCPECGEAFLDYRLPHHRAVAHPVKDTDA